MAQGPKLIINKRRVRLCIWENPTKKDPSIKFANITLDRVYSSEAGKGKFAKGFRVQDLADLKEAIEAAERYLKEL